MKRDPSESKTGNDLYYRLVENINSVIIELDEAGRIRFVNSFTERLVRNPDQFYFNESMGVRKDAIRILIHGNDITRGRDQSHPGRLCPAFFLTPGSE